MSKDSNSRAYRFRPDGDMFTEQARFFRAIESIAPRVLTSLEKDVLPVVVRAREEPGRSIWNNEVVWRSLWDWSVAWGLMTRADADLLIHGRQAAWDLGARQIAEVFRHIGQRVCLGEYEEAAAGSSSSAHAGDAILPEDSPAVTFGLRAVLPIAAATLRAWLVSTPQGRPSGWTIPENDARRAVLFGHVYMAGLGISVAGTSLAQAIYYADALICGRGGTGREPERDMVGLRVWFEVWSPDRETAAEGEDRITEAIRLNYVRPLLAGQARAWLDLGYGKVPNKSAKDHFDWLVRYQVNGQSCREVWQEVSDGDTPVEKAVSSGINTAAEKIIGSKFETWLR